MAVAPCAAVTNSDRAHGDEVQRQLGLSLNGWISAEDVRAYKPDARMWRAAAFRKGFGKRRDECRGKTAVRITAHVINPESSQPDCGAGEHARAAAVQVLETRAGHSAQPCPAIER